MKETALTRALKPEKRITRDTDVWIEGRWLYYAPTFSPSHEMKELGGRWENRIQAWRLPKLARLVRRVKEYDRDARLSSDALRIGFDSWDVSPAQALQRLSDADTHPTFADLYPFQQSAVGSLLLRGYHGVLLALSPGLGKTPTSIVAGDLFMSGWGKSQRALVVAPLSLLGNWSREIERWSSDPRVEICHGVAPTPDHSVRWTVTNYDSVLERVQDLTSGNYVVTGNLDEEWDFDWDVVIFDESVLLKNRKAKRTMAARTLARSAERVWLLSGAPITRDNSDVWSQFNVIEPDYFSSFWRFAKEFCVVVQTPWSMGEIVGSRHDLHLRDEYPELMFVRNQEQVFPDLPDYIYQDVELPLTKQQKKAHDDLMIDWIHQLESNPDIRIEVTVVIAQLIRLQQVTGNLKNLETSGHDWPDNSSKADYIEELLSDHGEIEWPCLIWTHFRPGAMMLYERLQKKAKKKDSKLHGKRIELVYGGTKGADAIIEDYKAGKVDVLILGTQVGKYGHTLTATRTVIFSEKTWDSDAHLQALYRVRRHGLKHRPLLINLRCRATVDDFVELNLAGKLPSMADLTGENLAKILRSLGEDRVA